MSDEAVRVIGAERLSSTLHKAAENLGDLTKANDKAAELVASEARPSTPRRTGRLASSVGTERVAGGARIVASISYAAPVHWGVPSRHMRAQPWISTAAQQTEPEWLGIYRDDVQSVCDSVKGA